MKDEKIPIAISSEEPVMRGSYEPFWEILDHNPGSIVLGRLRNGAALLFNHNRDEHLGIIDSPRIGSDRVLRGDALFAPSAMAQEKKRDVLAKTLPWVSVSYSVLSQVNERVGRDGIPVVRVTKWEPLEVSLVTVPADPTVGVGRGVEIRSRAAGDPETRERSFSLCVPLITAVGIDPLEIERLRLKIRLTRQLA